MTIGELVAILATFDQSDEVRIAHSFYSGSEDEITDSKPRLFYTADELLITGDGSNSCQSFEWDIKNDANWIIET